MRRTAVRLSGALLGASLLVALTGAPAFASTSQTGDSPESTTSVIKIIPMTFAGYDRAVAEANGYRIEVDENGAETSVPVTDEAKAEDATAVTPAALQAQGRAMAKQLGTVQPQGYDEVEGPCGLSYVDASHNGLQWVYVRTGYAVTHPVVSRWWSVWLNGTGGSAGANFNGGATPSVWGGAQNVPMYGGGIAHVTIGSNVQMTNGGICYSGNPSTWY